MADPAAIAREVMEYLLLQLRDAKPNQRNLVPPELHMTNGALLALTRAGLIDKRSAAAWQDRIREERNRILSTLKDEAEHRAPSIVLPPQQVERATIREILNDQLARIDQEIFSGAAQGRLIYPWNSRELAVAQALVRALAELGIMSELDERTWNEKLNRAADPEAEPVRTAHARARSAAAAEGRSAISVEQAEPPLVHPVPRCSQKDLVDVLLVREGSQEGVRLEYIEVYTDGLAINWSGPPIPHHPRGSSFLPHWRPSARVTDDLGTYYFMCGGGGGGSSGERSRGGAVFAPAIPKQATELHVGLDDDGFVITLPSPTTA